MKKEKYKVIHRLMERNNPRPLIPGVFYLAEINHITVDKDGKVTVHIKVLEREGP